MIKHSLHSYRFLLIILLLAVSFSSERTDSGFNINLEKIAKIKRTTTAIRIDGCWDDAAWKNSVPITDFIQESPENLAEPTEYTDIRLLYDDQAIYVFARMHDSENDKIVKRMAKRDDWMGGFEGVSDWFMIDFDSRLDHQTAFTFAVNAAGVKVDAVIINDSEYDGEWNAVWNAEVSIDSLGWNVEMKIPFSVLRFSSAPNMIWGLNIERYIQRKNELISWVPQPWGEQGLVSRYGQLHGLQNITTPARFEIKPYILFGSTGFNGDTLRSENTGDEHNTYSYHDQKNLIGLDIKYGLGSNTTLDLTINPDFGQIEADPAEINLTYFETRFPEKRPFFMENSALFDTPVEVFYSRRIGKNDAMIKSAAKLTGKTSDGLAYGLIGAVTTPMSEKTLSDRFFKGKNSTYFVGRILKDFLKGNSFAGIIATYSKQKYIVQKDRLDSAHAHKDTVSATLSTDGYFTFLDNKLTIDYQIAGSHNDDEQGVVYSGQVSYIDPHFYKTWLEYEYYDDKFYIKQLGYLYRNNFVNFNGGFQIRRQDPWKFIRYGNFGISHYRQKNTDNLNLGKSCDFSFHLTFMNYWECGGSIVHSFEHYADKLTYDHELERIGPKVKIPQAQGGHLYFNTDYGKPLALNISGGFGQNKLDDQSWDHDLGLVIKPTEFLELSLSHYYGHSNEKYHWLEILEYIADNDTINHYMFSNSDNKTEISTLWLSGNITRDISLQFYSEYFKSSNEFVNYMELSDLSENEFPISIDTTGYQPYNSSIDPDPSKPFVDPNLFYDFYAKYSSLSANVVLRWEYRSGSTLYLVYSYYRAVNGKQFSNLFDFVKYDGGDDWVEIYSEHSLFLKIDYWFNL